MSDPAQVPAPTYLKDAYAESGRIRHFGDDVLEHAALLGAAGLVPLLSHRVLRATGADRLEFVHGQVTNEVKRLKVGEFRTALMLNHKGHALAQMQVLRRADELLLIVEGGAAAQVERQLKAHIIFDQVVLEPQAEQLVFTLQGPQAEAIITAVFGAAPQQQTFVELAFAGETAILYPLRRSTASGFAVVVTEARASAFVAAAQAAGARLAGENALLAARVAAGIPLVETEAGDGVLPQEAGLEAAVSYTKGCYLGQEIMARIEARGKLRRGLQGLRLSARPKPGERTVQLDGKTVGQLGAVTEHPELGWLALAVLRTDIGEAALELNGVSAQVVALPFS